MLYQIHISQTFIPIITALLKKMIIFCRNEQHISFFVNGRKPPQTYNSIPTRYVFPYSQVPDVMYLSEWKNQSQSGR